MPQTSGAHEPEHTLMHLLTLQAQQIDQLRVSLDDKVDRVEFSQIIEGKANQVDLQKLLSQLLTAKTFKDLHGNENVREIMDSCTHGNSSCCGLTTGRVSQRSISDFGVDVPETLG